MYQYHEYSPFARIQSNYWQKYTVNKKRRHYTLAGLGTRNFYFQDRKKFEISGHFSGHQSHKKAFFVISAHITSECLELRLK